MKTDFKETFFRMKSFPYEIMLSDGTRFTRTPLGAYVGVPTAGQVGEIEGQLSNHSQIALVRTRHVGELPGFEIDYFVRES